MDKPGYGRDAAIRARAGIEMTTTDPPLTDPKGTWTVEVGGRSLQEFHYNLAAQDAAVQQSGLVRDAIAPSRTAGEWQYYRVRYRHPTVAERARRAGPFDVAIVVSIGLVFVLVVLALRNAGAI